MRTDKETGAPQFTERDLAGAGTFISRDANQTFCVYGVTVDDINLFLRAFYIRKLKRKRVRRKGTK